MTLRSLFLSCLLGLSVFPGAAVQAACQTAYDGILFDTIARPAAADIIGSVDGASQSGVEKIILYEPYYRYGPMYPDLRGLERARPDTLSLASTLSEAPQIGDLVDLGRPVASVKVEGRILAYGATVEAARRLLSDNDRSFVAFSPSQLDPGSDCDAEALEGLIELAFDYGERLVIASFAQTLDDWTTYVARMQSVRLFLGQLPRDLAEELGWRTAERLYGIPATPP